MRDSYQGEPLFIDTEENAVRPDLPFVEREAITAVLYNLSTKRYGALRWSPVDGIVWETLVTGGIEPGQTAEQAARTEAYQEMGYKNLRLIARLPNYHSKFYHQHKKENRFAHFRCFLFAFDDDERDEIAGEELRKHEPVFLSKEEMETFNLPEGHRFIFNEALTHL